MYKHDASKKTTICTEVRNAQSSQNFNKIQLMIVSTWIQTGALLLII